jgi:hypothetical protein
MSCPKEGIVRVDALIPCNMEKAGRQQFQRPVCEKVGVEISGRVGFVRALGAAETI